MVRDIIESQYTGVCNVIEYQNIKDPITKRTVQSEVQVLTAQKCRLSFKNISNTNESSIGNKVVQSIKLFLSPDITIKAGSKIVVTQNYRTNSYKNSGEAAVYETHQEIILEKFESWA